MSEVMTILIHFHQSHYRGFKAYYTQHVCQHMRGEFPKLVSYTRFVELIPSALPPLCSYLRARFGQTSGVAFIDSTPLPVCHRKRISRNRVFAGMAKRGKSSMGWFYGFKLHLIVNDQGELLAIQLTPGNTDDRKPVPQMAKDLWGKLVGDRGYLSQSLFEQLFAQGLQLITPIRKNMRNRLVVLEDKLLVRKRSIIETINDQLKNISQIMHTRHRSTFNFAVNLICGSGCLHLAGQKTIHPSLGQGFGSLTCLNLTPNSGYPLTTALSLATERGATAIGVHGNVVGRR